MATARPSVNAALGRGTLLVCLGLACSGCATQSLNRARTDFYSGRLAEADEQLTNQHIPNRDEVLFLMERGTIEQAQGDYTESTATFISAYDRLVELETYSVSRGAGSLVINDQIKDFVGAPFERTLLHTLTAHNHFSLGKWDEAAIEARRILASLSEEKRGDYPDDPYSRYIAGLAFELIDDPSNAALQYRLANELSPHVFIDPDTGYVLRASETNHTQRAASATVPKGPAAWTDELVVGLQGGRSPRGNAVIGSVPKHQSPVYAELYIDGAYAGRTYTLSDTTYLQAETDRVRALREAAKTISRIAIKEGIAIAVESNNNELAGDLVRLILIGLLEHPDTRRWETLPRWFQVARVPAPPNLTSYTVKLKNANGQTIRTYDVTDPLQRRRNTWISFIRDVGSS